MNEMDTDLVDQEEDIIDSSDYSPVGLYVIGNFNPDMRSVLFHVDDVFAKFRSGHHLHAVETLLLAELDDEDPAVLKNKVLSIYDESLKTSLAAFGIGVVADCRDYRLLADMLDALALAQFQYSKDFIEPLLAVDDIEGEEHTYATLVSALTPSRLESVLEVIVDFKPALITNLAEIIGRNDDALDEHIASRQGTLERFKTFLRGRRYGLAFDVARRSCGFGIMGWKELYLLLEDGLVALDDAELAYELVSLVLVSSVGDEEVESTLRQIASVEKERAGEIASFTELLLSEWRGEE